MANRIAKRRKEWMFTDSAIEADFTTDTTLLFTTLLFTETRTILRMLGEFVIGPTAAPVDGDGVEMSVGFGIVSADAVGVGSTAMPDPSQEPEYPWLYWSSHPFFFRSTDVQQALGTGVVRVPFDVRSMRKVKPREALISVVQYVNSGGNPPMTAAVGQTRVLVALP